MWDRFWYCVRRVALGLADDRLSGAGLFAGDGSVHYCTMGRGWSPRHAYREFIDRTPLDQIGATPGLTPHHWRVQLRFTSQRAAMRALAKLEIVEGRTDAGEPLFTIVANVPVIERAEGMHASVPADVAVHW